MTAYYIDSCSRLRGPSSSIQTLIVLVSVLFTLGLSSTSALSQQHQDASRRTSRPQHLDNPTSLLIDTTCNLQLTIGRVEGTAMPLDWAKSGARLVLPDLKVAFGKEPVGKREALLGDSQLGLEPASQPVFVGAKGLTYVPVEAGAYSIFKAPLNEGYDCKHCFRFHLQFPDGATRNDVVLPAEEPVYFTSTCWMLDSEELAGVKRQREEVLTELKDVSELYDKLEIDNGVLQQTLRLRSKILLLERREELERFRDRQAMHLPDDNILCHAGMVFAKDGYITVKRKGGFLGMQEQYHIVGTFSIGDFVGGED